MKVKFKNSSIFDIDFYNQTYTDIDALQEYRDQIQVSLSNAADFDAVLEAVKVDDSGFDILDEDETVIDSIDNISLYRAAKQYRADKEKKTDISCIFYFKVV